MIDFFSRGEAKQMLADISFSSLQTCKLKFIFALI